MTTRFKKPRLSKNALIVLKRRYLRKDEKGRVVETPAQMFLRVAHHIAEVEKIYNPKTSLAAWRKKYYAAMARLEFLPNSPTLMNIGTPMGQLAACFVIPVEDSMEGIFDAIKYSAIIHKTGGGTGFSFSQLRPKDDMVRTTHGVSSGPVSFMRVFDAATEAIKQGGTRRGANMGILRVDHPDILEFIEAKSNERQLANFNISVGITDAFMKALQEGRSYPLVNPRTRQKVGSLDARKVFQKIVHHAWRNGEPGLVFLDRIDRNNPTPLVGHLESTNPCGEQPLLPFESCNLGSINLAQFVRGCQIEWDRLREMVHLGVRFLDNVIEANLYPLAEIETQTKANRKIGLGVMGFADFLIQLGIPYDSDEAVALARRLMQFIQEESKAASKQLALQRGVFPNYDKSVYARQNLPQRNATTTTVAPTGTLSMIAGCSSGIEPLFALVYAKNVLDNASLVEVNPYFVRAAREGGFYSAKLMARVREVGSIQKIKEREPEGKKIPVDVARVFKTMRDIAPQWHVKMQAAFQAHTDNAVSKTVNLPQSATPKEVARVYQLAYDLGCKGITLYREGSRRKQVLTLTEKNGG